jgi:hypothetical protein
MEFIMSVTKYNQANGSIGERIMEAILNASSLKDASSAFTADYLREVALSTLAGKVDTYQRIAKDKSLKSFEELTSKEIIDYIFGIDMLVKTSSGLLVALDVTSSEDEVAKKLNRQKDYTMAYDLLEIIGFGVPVCIYKLEPTGVDLANAAKLLELFVDKLAKGKSITCKQTFKDF